MRSRAVVVGAGFGGLAAAVRLRSLGMDVTLLEALPDPGGRARTFHRDGFTFDAGPTVVTAPYLFDELFTQVGRDPRDYFELLPVDPYYRLLLHDGSTFDMWGDDDRLLAEIEAFEPRDVDGYRRLAAHARRIFELGYLQLSDRPFPRFRDMARLVPRMARLRSHRSVYGLVSRYLRDERLRRVFTFEPLLVGGDPFRTTSIYLLIHTLERQWGVHFVKGGTGALVDALVSLLDELGVEVRSGEPVERIQVEGGRVRGVLTEAGRSVPAEYVVANADPARVYTRMIDSRHRRRNTDRAVRRRRTSMGLLVGYFGTEGTYPEPAHHTILLGSRYRGLLRDIFRRRVLPDDPSLYLHAPARTDPSMAPAGRDAFYVLAPVPNNRSGVDWGREGEGYMDRILEMLEERVLPGLGDRLVTRFHVSPDYFEHDLRSEDGSAFGPEPLLRQSAYFRYHNRCRDVDGLYFVGAGTHPGAGLPGVLSSARVLQRMVGGSLP